MGAREIIKNKLHLSWWRIPGLLRQGLNEYKKYAPDIKLFPAIPELLHGLQKTGYVLSIISSNNPEVIKSVLNTQGICVERVTHSSLFNKARLITKEARVLGFTKEETLYIGDEVRDAEAAKKAGVDCLSVTWGLNSQKALKMINQNLAESPEDILNYLNH